jgi:hypothetical protein
MLALPRDQPEDVWRMRYQRFRKLGFTRVEARLLADDPNVDLHLAEALHDAGCPRHLIEEIVT